MKTTNDPYLLDYVVVHLLKGVPENQGQFENLYKIHTIAVQKKMILFAVPLAELWTQIQREVNPIDWRGIEKEIGSLQAITRADKNELRDMLKDNHPLVRLLAIETLAQRRIHVERDLLPLFDDPEIQVRSAAHKALVTLSRGVDLGPDTHAGRNERLRAKALWHKWLATQDNGDEAMALDSPGDADFEILRLSTELVQAGPDRQAELVLAIDKLPGDMPAAVLAATVAQLKNTQKAQVQQLLVAKLSEKVQELKRFLSFDDSQVRKAAAEACEAKVCTERIADLLKLLEDPNREVLQAAQKALHSMTAQDFGPLPDADAIDRHIAVAEWYRWWVAEGKKQFARLP